MLNPILYFVIGSLIIILIACLIQQIYRTHEDIQEIANTSAGVTGNWQSGTATSGSTGDDLVTFTIGGDIFVNFLDIYIGGLTAAASITIRMYHDVNGTERNFYSQSFTVGTDPDSIPVIDGTIKENSDLRVEVQSNNAGDNGGTVTYEVK